MGQIVNSLSEALLILGAAVLLAGALANAEKGRIAKDKERRELAKSVMREAQLLKVDPIIFAYEELDAGRIDNRVLGMVITLRGIR